MAEERAQAQTPLAQAEAALAEAQQQIQQLQRQQRELQAFARQIESELQPLSQRRVERTDVVRAIEANPSSYPAATIREAYESLSDAVMRHHMMQTQLDGLRQRDQWLGLQIASTVQNAATLEHLRGILAQQEGVGAGRGGDQLDASGDAPSAEVARQIVATREERSRWLAHHLQEGPVQALTNLVLQAEVSQRLLGRNLERASEEIQSLKANLARTLGETRRFVAELHPPGLADLGLRSTLRRYVTETAARTGREIILELPGQEVRLAAELEIDLFRVAQQSLLFALITTTGPVNMVFAMSPSEVSLNLSARGTPAVPPAQAGDEEQCVRLYAQALGALLRLERQDGLGLRLEFALVPTIP